MLKLTIGIFIASFCLNFALATTELFKQQCLDEHNKYRAMHSTPPLELDDEIQAVAQDWADELAGPSALVYGKRPNNIYGENVWGHLGGKTVNITKVIGNWYNTLRNYDWENPQSNNRANRATQMLWKSTTKFGCAFAKNSTLENVYLVANYGPKGNIPGQYKQNVLPLKN